MDINGIFEVIQHGVFWASLASALLPPVKVFRRFPKFQKMYETGADILSTYGALNARKKLEKLYQISPRKDLK